MEFITNARKKTERFVEKSVMGVSDAIYATGSAFEKGGSRLTSGVTSFFASSAEAVGDIGTGICNLVGATKTSKVQEMMENETHDDIMAEEEAEDQKVRQSARDAIDRLSSDDKRMVGASSKREIDRRNLLLPLTDTPDAWMTASPVTLITSTPCPFHENGRRPTEKELDNVYKLALNVAVDPVNVEYKDDLEAYIMKMFGKSKELHEGLKTYVALDKTPKAFKLHLKLVDGKDLLACDANGKSDPYCYISVIKRKHVDMITSAKPNLANINESKQLNLNVHKSHTQDRTLTPVWNESFQFDIPEDGKGDMIVIEVWDSDENPVKFKEASLSKLSLKFFKDLGDSSDDFMGRAFMPLSAVGFTEKEKVLTLHSRNKKKQFGEVKIRVSLVGQKPAVDNAVVMKEHSQLAATVLDFEAHVTGEYIAGWNTKVTPLGYKLISLNAAMNGLSELQQAAVLFPLLQYYDKHINLSIIGYFGVVHMISYNQEDLPSGPTGSRREVQRQEESYSEWVQTIFECLDSLDSTLIGVLRRHHQFFNFRTEEGIDYLALHMELIKELYTIVPHVERLEDIRKSLQQTIHDACTSACVGWLEKLFAQAIPISPNEKERLLCFLEVVDRIKQRLHNTMSKTVQSIFEEVGVDYYTLLYTTVDKQMSAEIQDYLTNRITKGHVPSYQLYLHLNDVLKLATSIPPKTRSQLHLNGYHEWFTGLVADWLDAAASKCNTEIKRAITGLEEVVTVTDNVKFSQSALSAAACFKRMAAFWNNLNWPKVAEHYAFIIRVVENVAKAAKFYVEESHKHMKKKGFHHDNSSKAFVVTQQLCISLNDIEYVREELSKVPETLQFDTVISKLAAVEGDAQAVNARNTLMTLINTANSDMQYLINNLLSSVGEQMTKDINVHIKTIIESDPKAELIQVLDPLMQYLARNMATFHSASLKSILEVAVEEIWNVIVHCYTEAVRTQLGQKAARRLKDSLAELETFFHAGGDGLLMTKIRTEEYKKTCESLSLQGSTDDELIAYHLRTLAKWTRKGEKEDGELFFSVGYIQDKGILEITVVKGKNIPGMKSNGLSDPYVEIVMMPERRFKIKALKTDFKSKDVCPTYYKDFKINVKEDLLNMSGSVLTLTVFDHDYIKKNEFCGIVVVDCGEIPRLPSGSSGLDDPNAPQRKTFELSLVVDTATPALKELAERSHQYVHDFNLWYKRGSTYAENIAKTFTGGFARVFSLKH